MFYSHHRREGSVIFTQAVKVSCILLRKGQYHFTRTGVANYGISMHCHEYIRIQNFDQWRHCMPGQEAPGSKCTGG